MDTLTLTAKVKLLPDEDAQKLIRDTMVAYQKACNHVSQYIFDTHDLIQTSIHKQLYRVLRSTYGLRSQMASSAIKTVLASYRSMRSNKHKWTRPQFCSQSYVLVWNRDYTLKPDGLSLNTIHGRLIVPYCIKGMESYFDKNMYEFGTAVLFVTNNQFYLSIPVTRKIELCSKDNIQCVVGIDRGVNFVVTTYDSFGKSGFVSGRAIKQKRKQYVKRRKELQMRQTSSSRRRLKRIGYRENRWMRDVNHCITKALVTSYPEGTLFVLEDLTGIRKATEKVRVKDRYVSVSWAFDDFAQKLVYKAKLHGQAVLFVDPRYTSQTCPKCGHTERGNRDKGKHIFVCKACGYTSNDDRIGAMNLYTKGIAYVSES